MTPTEAVILCRFARSICPQQHFDEFTPDAWGEVLGNLRLVDCKEALVELATKQPFVSPAEIRTEVRRIRRQRTSDFGVLPDPPSSIDPDDTAAYCAWLARTQRAIADGDLKPQPPLAIEPPAATEELADLRAKAKAGLREGLEIAASREQRPTRQRPEFVQPPQPATHETHPPRTTAEEATAHGR